MNAVSLFAQDTPIALNDVMNRAVSDLEARIPAESKVVVLNIVSDKRDLSDCITTNITEEIVTGNFFTAVDRHNFGLIEDEITFQLSDEVCDATAQAIGYKLGAECIISGSIAPRGDLYRFQKRKHPIHSLARI
jgi:hypothetical protein